jgi:hypothetical protein
MKLKSIAKKILIEQELNDEDIIELSSMNMSASINPFKKSIILVPIDLKKQSEIRKVIVLLKTNFRIVKVNNLSDEDSKINKDKESNMKNSFEVVVDPRENFDSVVDFIKNQ